MNSYEDRLNNPFFPGHPVSPDYFIGRNREIDKILRYLPRVIEQGIPEHFFITGKRGMGKTSFVNYISNIARDEFGMFPVYVNNQGTDTIDELIRKLLDKLFLEFNKTKWGRNIIKIFFDHFNKINFLGLGFEFKNMPEIVVNVKENFIQFLVEICSNLKGYDGIFIVIDDVNGLSQTPEFANWYKALFETLEFYNENVPVAFSLVTYPAKFYQLCQQNPSFPRMFNLIEIDKLNDEDVKSFFKKTLSNFNLDFSKQYAQDMIYYSWGMPLVMQQIGDCIFWNLDDYEISEEIVYDSIRDVALELKNKYLKQSLSKIKNPKYNIILLKLAYHNKFKFTRNEICELLEEYNQNIFDEFLNQMITLNILEFNGNEYEFVNISFFVYFLISSSFNILL